MEEVFDLVRGYWIKCKELEIVLFGRYGRGYFRVFEFFVCRSIKAWVVYGLCWRYIWEGSWFRLLLGSFLVLVFGTVDFRFSELGRIRFIV